MKDVILAAIRSAMPTATLDTSWSSNPDINGRIDAMIACEDAGFPVSLQAADWPQTVLDFVTAIMG